MIDFAQRYDVTMALCLDSRNGVHDQSYGTVNEFEIHGKLQKTIEKLLKAMPYAPACLTVDSSAASTLADTAEMLYQSGSRVICIEVNPI